jgi:hypothetical protein
MNATKNKNAQTVESELRERGATLEKKEDRNGDTKSGWWMDDVWLAPKSQPAEAMRILEGN